ncbi:MAG TPA: BamA/TamA family outer membrane protein [Gemmatimonadales bacterium]|nr:BamA/TamA family outer membrane protein [Gemmatimonadales bacterium]
MKIATYDLASGRIEVLPGMEYGKNVSPQWSPDGQELAYVSDRTGVSNIYLYDLGDQQSYQITDLFTGAQGITPLSPVLSWAPGADKLAFVYYSRGMYDVYAIDNPRSLKKSPWRPVEMARRDSVPAGVAPQPVQAGDTLVHPAAAPDTTHARPVESTGSLYVGPGGLRPAEVAPAPTDSTLRPMTIAALMDSVQLPLPDTAEFKVTDYKVHFQPDYVARPSIGYSRDTFGQGFYGGSAIALSDLLGDHQLFFAAYVNGRLSEALVNATYVNTVRRLNWAVSAGQQPYYFLEPSRIVVDSPSVGTNTFVTNLRRIVFRSVGLQGIYPLTRFQRFEFGVTAANISDHRQTVYEPFDNFGNQVADATENEVALPSESFVEPSVAYVFDNSLTGWVGPFYGRRYRLQASQSIGGWRYFEGLFDYRRYDHLLGPIVLATRAMYFGRIGRDAEQFPVFVGNTDLIRGYTSGSFYRNECTVTDPNTATGCVQLDRLVGTQIAVGNAELRFPILTPDMHFVPMGVPPIEGALFYDVGLAWNSGDVLRWSRRPGDDPELVRAPVQSVGVGARMNLFNFVVLRLDYSFPLDRPGIGGYVTLSLGPVF